MAPQNILAFWVCRIVGQLLANIVYSGVDVSVRYLGPFVARGERPDLQNEDSPSAVDAELNIETVRPGNAFDRLNATNEVLHPLRLQRVIDEPEQPC